MVDPRFNDSPVWARQREATPYDLSRVRARAREIAAGPIEYEPLMRVGEEFRGFSTSWWPTFGSELVAAIHEDRAREQAWVEMLEDQVARWKRASPFGAGQRDTEAEFRAAAEDWRRDKDAFSVWKHRSSHLQSRDNETWRMLSQLNLLVRIDPIRGLRACDTLPFPGLMNSVFYWGHDVRRDRELIEALLPAAPSAFDVNGGWGPDRSVAALLVTHLIVEHAQSLHAAVAGKILQLKAPAAGPDAPVAPAEQALRDVETMELPEWMRRAFGLLLQRQDGRTIALGYLAHLVARTHGDRMRGTQKMWSAFEQGLRALCDALAAVGATTADVHAAWARAEEIAKEKACDTAARRMVRRVGTSERMERVGEGAKSLYGRGIPYLWGAAHLLGGDPGSQDVQHIWTWFEDLLEKRDPGLSLVKYGSADEAARRFGLILSRAVRPAELFHKTYNRLEPQRRRTQHGVRYGGEDDFETMFLLRVGLHAVLEWHGRAKQTPEADAARDLFFTIYSSARRLWLTAGRFDDTKKDLVPLCFAFMPAIFGEDIGCALAKTIPPIANHARMLADACWFLWKNTVEPTRLANLVREAGGDLERALRDAKQWSDLVAIERPGLLPVELRERDFPSSLQQLAEALGFTFPEDQSAPESARMAQRRNDFLSGIPWGAALLHRLDEDGLTRIRFSALDAGTWCLQVDAPAALSDHFGLGLQLRIVVVHGQVRGRDLRLAVDDPRDGAEVDPDLIVVASDWPFLQEKINHLGAPWGQRIPWTPDAGSFVPLAEALREHLPRFDIFRYRDPIRGRALVGRRDLIDDISARLLSGQAVAVVGLRKVGKSSLLHAVAARIDPIGAQRGMFGFLEKPTLDAEAEALMVSFDVQGLIHRTLPGLARELAKELRARLAAAGVREERSLPAQVEGVAVVVEPPVRAAPDEQTEAAVPDWMEELERLLHLALDVQPRPIVFVLDEYDLLFVGYGGEPGIPEIQRLFALLRSLSQATGRVSLAFIGRDPVFVQEPHLGGFTSPLLGWVQPMWLGPLRRDEADELLVRLGKRTGLEVGAATLETAWRWTGGHPLLLREYGSALFELAHAPPSRPRPAETDALRDDAVEVFYRRDAVQTICDEVHMLFEVRFSEALSLIEALADAPAERAREVIERHGGTRGKAAAVLAGFGLTHDTAGGPRVAELWRGYFKTYTSEVGGSAKSGTDGE